MMRARTDIPALPAALLLCILSCGAPAQDWDVSGYLKNFATGGLTLYDEYYYLVTHRLRVNLEYYPVSEMELRAIVDNQLTWGSYLQTEQYSLSKTLEQQDYIDLTLDPVDNEYALWQAVVHRLYLRYSGDNIDLTAGRQRIAWGTGRIWNPTDLFNPNSPLTLEPSERRGSDSVHVAWRPADDLQLEAAWAIGADRDDARWAARGRTCVGSYDLSFMAGRFRGSEVVGFDFSGYVADAGLRGEFTYTWEDERSYARAVLSYEYTFGNGIDLLAEYLYNGGNLGRFTLEDAAALAAYDSIISINRHFLALLLARELFPLVSGRLLTIVDLEDGSLFAFPMIYYSLAQDVDLTLGVQLFFGDDGDFSLYSHTALVALEWYF